MMMIASFIVYTWHVYKLDFYASIFEVTLPLRDSTPSGLKSATLAPESESPHSSRTSLIANASSRLDAA